MARNSLASNVREWKENGWQVRKTGGGHLALTHEDVTGTVFTGSTPSDSRSVRNVEAQMRRVLAAGTTTRGAEPLAVSIQPTTEAPQQRGILRLNRKPAHRPGDESIPFQMPAERGKSEKAGGSRARHASRRQWATEDDTRNRQQEIAAFALYVLVSRDKAESWEVIATSRARFKVDAEYRRVLVARYLETSPVAFRRLRQRNRMRFTFYSPVIETEQNGPASMSAARARAEAIFKLPIVLPAISVGAAVLPPPPLQFKPSSPPERRKKVEGAGVAPAAPGVAKFDVGVFLGDAMRRQNAALEQERVEAERLAEERAESARQQAMHEQLANKVAEEQRANAFQQPETDLFERLVVKRKSLRRGMLNAFQAATNNRLGAYGANGASLPVLTESAGAAFPSMADGGFVNLVRDVIAERSVDLQADAAPFLVEEPMLPFALPLLPSAVPMLSSEPAPTPVKAVVRVVEKLPEAKPPVYVDGVKVTVLPERARGVRPGSIKIKVPLALPETKQSFDEVKTDEVLAVEVLGAVGPAEIADGVDALNGIEMPVAVDSTKFREGIAVVDVAEEDDAPQQFAMAEVVEIVQVDASVEVAEAVEAVEVEATAMLVEVAEAADRIAVAAGKGRTVSKVAVQKTGRTSSAQAVAKPVVSAPEKRDVAVKAAARPVKAAARPVKAATRPVKAATRPVKAAARPVKAAARPVKAAARPVKAAARPVKAATRPVKAVQKLAATRGRPRGTGKHQIAHAKLLAVLKVAAHRT